MTNVIVHHLVATSPSAMWHLLLVLKSRVGQVDVSAHLGVAHCCCLSLLSVIGTCRIVAMLQMVMWP